jgi:hypothetical protein
MYRKWEMEDESEASGVRRRASGGSPVADKAREDNHPGPRTDSINK